MKYFRVKNGFGPTDFLSIDETELAMALRAHITGKVGVFKTGTVSGNNIISITPDYQRELGVNPEYHLTGDDYRELGQGVVRDYERLMADTRVLVTAQLEGRAPIMPLTPSKEVRELAGKMKA